MSSLSVLILFLLALAFLLRIDFIFYIIYFCVGVYAWSRWYTPRALQKTLVSRHFVDHVFWNETIPITIHLANGNWLPIPWVQFAESIAVQLAMGQSMDRTISLRGREDAEFTYEVRAGQRGYYRLGPLRLTMGDAFGLIKEQQRLLPAEYLTVYPRIIPLTRLGLPSRMPFGTIASHQRLFEDPTRPNGTRDFRSGDSLRQINWKVSGHTRHLVVKTYEPAITLETAVLLNLHLDDYRRQNRQTYIEWAIVVAASLAAHLVNRRQSVGLITNGIDPLSGASSEGATFDKTSGRLLISSSVEARIAPAIAPRPGRAQLMKMLEQLARIESGDTIAFQQWAPRACFNLSWGITILVITARGDNDVCQALHRLVRTGYNPVLIAIEPDYNFGQVRERSRRLGFAAYQVTGERDLDRWRQPQTRG
jgi:uncharacterized protein (DUF58 family)